MPATIAWAESAETLLHVLDLPQLHTKPAASELLQTLELLTVKAPSWDQGSKKSSSNAIKAAQRPQVAPEGVPKYLTSIIASQLSWIKDDELKEAIWEAASLRLAERSGRTAMPAMSRQFIIEVTDGDEIELSIYEPSLTGDSLGLKTWAASYLLAKRLHTLDIPKVVHQPLRILELGSGTGLVGMAAAAVLRASVLLTDLPEIESNLALNVKRNDAMIQKRAGVAMTAVLDWTVPDAIFSSSLSVSTTNTDTGAFEIAKGTKFPVIVAADSIYSADHPAMLVEVIKTWLAPGSTSRVIIELPRRDGYSTEIEDFRGRMLQMGLRVLQEGEETGYDDWGGSTDEELQEVNCWWSIWTWN